MADHGLVGGGEAFEFFKPVEDDVDVGPFLIWLHHQEPLAVWGNVIVLYSGVNAAGSPNHEVPLWENYGHLLFPTIPT